MADGGTAADLDHDSAFGDGDSTDNESTFSLDSSITRSIQIYGRSYHAYHEGAYWGPNDERQAVCSDISHGVYVDVLNGRLLLAPIDPDLFGNALDIGTGTGRWAIEFADQFERWNVLGTDLSPIQPREVPPNLRFEVDDACYAWTHRANSFDYIHMRLMYGSVENWPRLYSEVFRHLKPGAWFEQMEIGVIPRSDDGTIPPNSAFDSWGALALKASDEFGKTLRTVDEMKDNIIRAGFVDVTEVRFKLPMGPWSMDKRVADMGEANRTAWLTGLEGFCLYLLTRILRWPKLSVDVYVAQMRAMLLDKSVHAYQDCAVVIGRKP